MPTNQLDKFLCQVDRVIESKGIRVRYLPLRKEKDNTLYGISFGGSIHVNKAITPSEKLLTLFHEYFHEYAHRPFLKRFKELPSDVQVKFEQLMELEAHLFATTCLRILNIEYDAAHDERNQRYYEMVRTSIPTWNKANRLSCSIAYSVNHFFKTFAIFCGINKPTKETVYAGHQSNNA